MKQKKKQKAFKFFKKACLFNTILKISNIIKLFRIRINASNLIIKAFLN